MNDMSEGFGAGKRVQTSEALEKLVYRVIGAAIEVHRILGPGHLEHVYRDALCIELELRGIPARREVPYDLLYKGRPVGQGRIDLFLDEQLVLELKACEALTRVHTATTISYLRCMNRPLALLINFNVALLQEGVKRVIYSEP
ncbi:MAG TPA: GxxExxY protein [Tepidisphaeraceae bacterium]|jgi:GxxExxY protein